MFQLCFNLFVFNERLWTNFRNMISLVEFVVSGAVLCLFLAHTARYRNTDKSYRLTILRPIIKDQFTPQADRSKTMFSYSSAFMIHFISKITLYFPRID